ncbi:hypothetical protein [Paeniglutamicibacter terrestris]|uniref:Uncharacterized protein n=1 Tax=Paeniglutamicibacter terrestris TaxID=2723403 RepID=A0ABX1G498_9MICC|nr:hypothetical protein [Paeniglutamicibacter terrestris]NKG21067.1 hypothetical protein [Paeniglutamicibacter terrestris]
MSACNYCKSTAEALNGARHEMRMAVRQLDRYPTSQPARNRANVAKDTLEQFRRDHADHAATHATEITP